MTRQIINIGTGNLTGDGENIRSAFDKSNKNFEELFSLTNFNSVTSHIIPSEDEVYDLGSPTNKWKSLYISSSTIYFNTTPLTIQNDIITIGTGSEQINFATEDFVIQQISNIVESDTVFSSSTAASITATDVTNWNTAYSWGDHGAVGYLTSTNILNNQSASLSLTSNGILVFPDLSEQSTAIDTVSISRYKIISTITQTLSIDNPNIDPEIGDQFGYAVAINSNYYCIGSRLDDNSGIAADSGKVFVYNASTNQLLYVLTSPNEQSFEYFGQSLDLFGDKLIVGGNQGYAYVYDLTSGNLVHSLLNPNPDGGNVTWDNFGISVSISENYAIVGAPWENNASVQGAGKVYIFDIVSGSLLRTIESPDVTLTNWKEFGTTVAISGNKLIIGAPYEDEPSYTNAGRAYIFDADSGSLIHTLLNPSGFGTPAYDNFGLSVDIQGNYAIVGAPWESQDSPSNDVGKAYIFNVTTGEHLYTLDNPNIGPEIVAGQKDQFGHSVALSDNYAVVGTFGEDAPGQTNSGKVYIFSIITGEYLYYIDNPNKRSVAANDYFGRSVSIYNNTLLIGAYGEYQDNSLNLGGVTYKFNIVENTAKSSTLNDVVNINFSNGTSQSTAYRFISPPNSSTSTGITGSLAQDSTYFYVCTATNAWQRVAWDNTPW